MSKQTRILVTGASGYIGGRLLPELLTAGYTVASMVRRPEQFKQQCLQPHDCRYGDTLELASLEAAFKDIDVVFYLVHSLAREGDFMAAEAQSARNVCAAAKKTGVKKIIYLGGLFSEEQALSSHLKSRKEVGDIIRHSGIPSITLRASIILGTGSISYEMIRNLTERLPVMITPKWVRVKAQPIAISDVLAYLKKAITVPVDTYEIYEIGGADQLSYADIMIEYAKQAGLKRWIIPVPVLSPYLSSLWLSFFTPIYARIGRKLIKSIKTTTVVSRPEHTFKAFQITPLSVQDAIRRTRAREEQAFAKTHWATAHSTSNYSEKWMEKTEGNKLVYTKKIAVNASIEQAFQPIETIGGKHGWYYWEFLWKIRGIIDIALGGPGYARGRRHPSRLHQGDFLDWWRVEYIQHASCLRLAAEMKLPGRAWLEFELKERSAQSCDIYVSAVFDPTGLLGRLYWYSLYPIHFFMFNGLLRVLKQKAESQ